MGTDYTFYLIPLGILFGIIIILALIVSIFPKNRISKRVKKILDWIVENIHF